MGAAKKSRSGPSFTQAQRLRKMVSFTLSDEARDRLELLAEVWGTSKSAVIERLILATEDHSDEDE